MENKQLLLRITREKIGKTQNGLTVGRNCLDPLVPTPWAGLPTTRLPRIPSDRVKRQSPAAI